MQRRGVLPKPNSSHAQNQTGQQNKVQGQQTSSESEEVFRIRFALGFTHAWYPFVRIDMLDQIIQE